MNRIQFCLIMLFLLSTMWANAATYVENVDGTVTDTITGLVWLKNADCFGFRNWQDALAVSNTLADGQCGLSDKSKPGDWRLPNINELESLVDRGYFSPSVCPGVFINVQSYYYWSSSTDADYAGAGNTDYAWYVYMGRGTVANCNKDTYIYVWPVRSRQ